MRYRDPRTALDKVANPRTDEWFVSARGRMRAPAGAHYARARVYRRPHARGRYVGANPISGVGWLSLSLGGIPVLALYAIQALQYRQIPRRTGLFRTVHIRVWAHMQYRLNTGMQPVYR